jgi:hypothetical protein
MTITATELRTIERLKTHCLAHGLTLTPAALAVLSANGKERLTVHEYATTGGVTLELPEGVLVNAPFDEPFCANSDVTLDADSDGRLWLTDPAGVVEVVQYLHLPGYLDAVDAKGRRVTDTVMSHADRIRLSPFVGCAYDCKFCDLGEFAYAGRPSEQLLAALDVAMADDRLPARHVLISGGSPRKVHYEEFVDTCVDIIRTCPLPVDIMMSPMVDGTRAIDRLVDAGVAGFSLNIELFSDKASELHLKRKFRTTRAHFDKFVERAVELLGRNGAVRSLIIPGLEPPEATLQGVEHLASMGCEPVLSPFRPARGTALVDHVTPEPALLSDLLDGAREIVARHGISLGPQCVPCQHNTLTFPWDRAGVRPVVDA